MTKQPHIGLLYSYGPHFVKTARALRERYPEADIVAFVPESFPVSLLEDVSISCRSLLADNAHRRAVKKIVALVRAIRRERLDIFVVLFNSPRLQLLSAISGSKERRCRLVDGREFEVHLTLLSSLVHTLVSSVVGRWRYARIWLNVHCTRVYPQKNPQVSGKAPHQKEKP